MTRESNFKLPLTIPRSLCVGIVFNPCSLASNGGEVSVGGQHNV